MQPPSELNRFALTAAGRRSRYGFCFVLRDVRMCLLWSVSRTVDVFGGIGRPQRRWSAGFGWYRTSFPDPLLCIVPLGKALPFIAEMAIPSSMVDGNVVLMMNPVAATPERLSGVEAGRAHGPSCLCRTPGSIVPILPSQADAMDGSRLVSATDRVWALSTGDGIVPGALFDCD